MIGDYVVLAHLGEGSWGKVKLVQHSKSGVLCAMKIVKKSDYGKFPDFQGQVYREISVMRLLNHPHILRLIEVCESRHFLYIALEYARNGELYQLLANSGALPEATAMDYFRQLIYGLEYLHARSICHRDLKLENLLLTATNELKIADFGFARWMREDIAHTRCGSPHYAAPEVVRGGPYDGRAADVWSCGVILYALVSGRLPFCEENVRSLLAQVRGAQFVMPAVSPDVQALLTAMLRPDPADRITVAQIKEKAAFMIGLSAVYRLPAVFPLRCADVAAAPPVLALLRTIGFRDEELTAPGDTMAKVFCYALTHAFAPEELPWDDKHRVEGARRGGEFIQPCIDIEISMDELLGRMQEMLAGIGCQWFHPDDRTIFARATSGMGITVRADRQEDGAVKMDVQFANAEESEVEKVLARLRELLVRQG